MRRLALLAVLALAACDPTLSALQTQKDQAAAGDLAAIAATPVTCDLSTPGCDQSRAIRGDACLRLAQDALAASRPAAIAPNAACAEAEYAAVLGAGRGSAELLAARRLEALRLAREGARSIPAGQAANDTLGAAATDYATRFPGRGEGGFYRATAILWSAAFAPGPDRCAQLAEAGTLAAAAASAPADGRALPGGIGGPARAAEARAATLRRTASCPG